MAGIKETKDVIALAKAATVEIKAALANGFDWTDVMIVANLWTPAQEAFEGATQIMTELKDLDADEVKELAFAIFELGAAIVELVRKAMPAA